MLPRFLWRMRKRGGYRDGFFERVFRLSPEKKAQLAHLPQEVPQELPQAAARIWVHAVSVGELQVARAWMRAWREAYPQARFVLTVNTSTAHRIAAEALAPEDVLLYPPVDSPLVLKRFFRQVKVRMLVLVETEMWPNMLRACQQRQIPVVLLNGRVSDRSFRRLRKIPVITRRVYPLVNLYCMQSGMDAERVRILGAPADAVKVFHSHKYDLGERDPAAEAARQQQLQDLGFLSADSVVLLGSSTWPGEEAALARIFQQARKTHATLRLILVPRHFERTHEVEADLQALGLTWWCWRDLPEAPESVAEVLIVNTTGELRHFTALAQQVFIGKSLFRSEGQNPLEAAHAGCAIYTGRGMDNFRRIMEDLREADAVTEVQDETDLAARVQEGLAQPEAARARGQRAQALVARRKGSLQRSVVEIAKLVAD